MPTVGSLQFKKPSSSTWPALPPLTCPYRVAGTRGVSACWFLTQASLHPLSLCLFPPRSASLNPLLPPCQRSEPKVEENLRDLAPGWVARVMDTRLRLPGLRQPYSRPPAWTEGSNSPLWLPGTSMLVRWRSGKASLAKGRGSWALTRAGEYGRQLVGPQAPGSALISITWVRFVPWDV